MEGRKFIKSRFKKFKILEDGVLNSFNYFKNFIV